LPARNRESARPGLDLGGRERRIVKIPAVLKFRLRGQYRAPLPRQQPAGGSIVTAYQTRRSTAIR
jgi:hypothetical protein